MKDKHEDRIKKQKRDIQMLIILAAVALVFIVISFVIVLNSNEVEKLPVNPVNNGEKLEEQAGEQAENVPDSTGNESEEDVGKETDNEEAPNEAEEEEKEEKDNQVVAEGKKTYINEKTNVSYTIPSSWDGLVEIHEKNNLVEFFYKGEDLFLSLLTVTHGEYELNKDYYDSSYSVGHSAEHGLVLYGLPNEHPLARKEGSADYQELTAIMSDNYNFIKTIKTK